MVAVRKTPLETFRNKQKRLGMVRLEVQVRQDDVELFRGVAKALTDPAREMEARDLLKARFGSKSGANGFKELLASAPLEDVELDRARDFGRPVEL